VRSQTSNATQAILAAHSLIRRRSDERIPDVLDLGGDPIKHPIILSGKKNPALHVIEYAGPLTVEDIEVPSYYYKLFRFESPDGTTSNEYLLLYRKRSDDLFVRVVDFSLYWD